MMSGDPATEIAKEIAGQLPVKEAYSDALSPSMKQFGQLIEDMAKTVRLALYPIQVAAAYQDKFAGFLKRSISNVSEEERIPPPKQILGPVLEGIKYEEEEGILWEMFSNLLSNSMDKRGAKLAHPAFPSLIKQLAPDEAKLLRTISGQPGQTAKIRAELFTNPEGDVTIGDWAIVDDKLKRNELLFPESFDLYFFHLTALNLIQQQVSGSETNQVYDFALSPLGKHFMSAVTRS